MSRKKNELAEAAEATPEPLPPATTTGEQIALQLFNSLEGDIRLTTGLLAFDSGRARLKKLKAAWDDQISQLHEDWSEDDAEILKAFIAGQRSVLVQLFTSMNPEALGGGKGRDVVVAQVDRLIAGTVAKVDKRDRQAPLGAAAS